MKALSLWQPWASLWANGRKRFETRSWATQYRGSIAVHAAKTICTEIDEELREICEEEFGSHWTVELPAGALIATAQLIACLPTERLHVDADERTQGNFAPGRYAWDTMNMKELPRPISYRGFQALFEIPDDLLHSAPPDPTQKRLI